MDQVTGTTEAKGSETSSVASAPAAAQGAAAAVATQGAITGSARKAAIYLASAFALTAASLGLVMQANRQYAPEYYEPDYMESVADAFENGESYAVFDLNINIRKLRDEQLKRLVDRPSIVVLGASQWQEAAAELLPDRGYLNAHVHRDYYEDVLGMVELLVRHDKLPKDLVITIRDRLFTPVGARTDFLWLPGVPYYQAMAKRLSLEPLGLLEAYPLQRPRELLSLPLLFANATRWHNAKDWPSPTSVRRHPTLDLLNPDGSITWSLEHQAIFTQERSRKISIAHAEANRAKPPAIDPKGVEALDRLLAFLALRGVKVHLAHPPFNPIFFDRVQDSPYMEGLRQVEAVTRELAAKHKLGLVGSFDPEPLGCTAEMFIDAEHSNAGCLRMLLAEVGNSVDLPSLPPTPQTPPAEIALRDLRSRQAVMTSGWMGTERGTRDTVASSVAVVDAPSLRDAQAASRDIAKISVAVLAAAEPQPEPADTAVARVRAPLPVSPDATAADLPVVATPMPRQEPVRTEIERPSRKAAPVRAVAREARRRPVPTRPRLVASRPGLVWPGDAPVRQR